MLITFGRVVRPCFIFIFQYLTIKSIAKPTLTYHILNGKTLRRNLSLSPPFFRGLVAGGGWWWVGRLDNKPPTTTTHVSLRGVFQAFPTPLSFSFSSSYSLFIISGTVTESLSLYLVFSLFLGGNFSCYACTYVRIAYADDPRKSGFARVFFVCQARGIVGGEGGWWVVRIYDWATPPGWWWWQGWRLLRRRRADADEPQWTRLELEQYR